MVNSWFLYFSVSVKIRECSMGVYAASAPYFLQSIRNGSSELSTIGATINLGRPSLAQWAHALSIRASSVRHRLGDPKVSDDVSYREDSCSCCWALSEQRTSSLSCGGSKWRVRVRVWAMRIFEMKKQELREERRGLMILGLKFMSGRWDLMRGNPSPPLLVRVLWRTAKCVGLSHLGLSCVTLGPKTLGLNLLGLDMLSYVSPLELGPLINILNYKSLELSVWWCLQTRDS